MPAKQPDGHYIDDQGNVILVYSDSSTRDMGKSPVRRDDASKEQSTEEILLCDRKRFP